MAQTSMEDGVPVLGEEFPQDPCAGYDVIRVQHPVTRVITPLSVVVWPRHTTEAIRQLRNNLGYT